MKSTKIEWCDSTLNPVIGCKYGCEFCYARRLNNRFHYIEDFSKPQFFPDRLKELNTKKPYNIFMDSMSDIADWKDKWISETFEAIRNNPQHNYLFLTKRPSIYNRLLHFCNDNIWCGATITDRYSSIATICNLEEINNLNIFLSIEPLLEKIRFALGIPKYIKWVIIGAETGNRKGKIKPEAEWIEYIVSECDWHKIPVFMKDSLIPIIGEENMRREFPEGLKK